MSSRASLASLAEEMHRALCGALGLVLGVADSRPFISVATRRQGPRTILRGRTLDGYHVESHRTQQALELGIPMPRPEDIRGGWRDDLCDDSFTDDALSDDDDQGTPPDAPPDTPADTPADNPPNASAHDAPAPATATAIATATATDDATAAAEFVDFMDCMNRYVPAYDTCRRAAKVMTYEAHGQDRGDAPPAPVTTTWHIDATWEGKFWDADDPAKLATVQPSITLTVWTRHALLLTITYVLDPGFRAVHAAYAAKAAAASKRSLDAAESRDRRRHRHCHRHCHRHQPPLGGPKRVTRVKTSATETNRYVAPHARADPLYDPLCRAVDALPPIIHLSF